MLPSTVATFGHVPVLVRTWKHVQVADWPTLISPLGPGPPAMPSQSVSTKFLNVSVTLPVFLTMISYSTVWPSLPVSSSLVKLPVSSIRWSFSIV